LTAYCDAGAFPSRFRPHLRIGELRCRAGIGLLIDIGTSFAIYTARGVALQTSLRRGDIMLSWALTFLIVALIAAFFGFVGVAGTAAYIAKILFFVFLVLFVVSLIFGRRGPVV
jgi:uncharacterized membrane protein YtjA (UPF0391 family)